MAGKRNQPKATERSYNASAVAVVEPPAQVRPRESTIPGDVLSAMADALAQGWATNGATYESKQDAQNDAGKFKRALVRMVDGVENEKGLRSRTWETADGFVFAIGIRQPKS